MSIGMGNSSGEFTALHFTADRVPVAKTLLANNTPRQGSV